MIKTATIVGSGLAGRVAARLLANAGYKIVMYSECPYGLLADGYDRNNFYYQSYGPHILHYSPKEVNANKYKDLILKILRLANAEKVDSINKVALICNNEWYEYPMNESDLDRIDPEWSTNSMHSIPYNLKDAMISKVGSRCYSIFVEGYSTKMWGIDPSSIKVSEDFIDRIKINDKNTHQFFPEEISCRVKSFGSWLNNIYDPILFADKFKQEKYTKLKLYHEISDLVVFSGSPDELLEYEYGQLPYIYEKFELNFVSNATNFIHNGSFYNILNYGDMDLSRKIRSTYYEPLVNPEASYEKGGFVGTEYTSNTGGKDYVRTHPNLNIYGSRELYNKYDSTLKELFKSKGVDYLPIGRQGLYKYLDMDNTIISTVECVQNYLETKR